ncbi:transcriptional regulator of RNA polII, SAGA, subunit-domain-containing protein [Kockovaella imperatae]|uniref:Transcriptional regulator of RNA polII, SAGA, subunit-domain-containing protein n=1 Tax=Kockovaella imperatae TaxID=4999 RepID=A0A1Y1UQH8_9TREE|nr:transcriptional regulator of RNA polII, SAGA, subunit-domain-containing protein [Kockovaella imperatae]ORX40222.1 transcriptional regulator of RNA polII, SAGA, subunit-domain-containing protein [Kockovaella imperatae]
MSDSGPESRDEASNAVVESGHHVSPRQNGMMTHQPEAGPSRPPPPPLPPMVEKLFATDIQLIKQELHDALGEAGLAYWKTLNGYLLGQIGKSELEVMVRGWLKGSKVQLHNQFMMALLYHAGIPHAPSSGGKKRKRVGPEDPDYDVNEYIIEPKARVQQWMQGIGGRERARIRRAVIGRQGQDEDTAGEADPSSNKNWGIQAGNTMPPLAVSAKQLPASHQLSHRLSQLAKAYDLNLAPDALSAIGEFMAVELDAHLSDILHAYVHLAARDRIGSDTLHVPPGLNPDLDLDVKVEDGGMTKPDLDRLRDLFTLNPGLHPSTSPALYKLASSLSQAEAEYNSSPLKLERKPSLTPEIDVTPQVNGDRAGPMMKKLVNDGLVKVDNVKKGEDGEVGGKKDKKHNLHWRYEDPALILKDVFG